MTVDMISDWADYFPVKIGEREDDKYLCVGHWLVYWCVMTSTRCVEWDLSGRQCVPASLDRQSVSVPAHGESVTQALSVSCLTSCLTCL